MHIIEDDLTGSAIRDLLETHFAGMLANSPKDSTHFLDFEGLKAPGVTFWSIWDGGSVMPLRSRGWGRSNSMMHIWARSSMRTHADHLRKGVAAAMVTHIIATARQRGLQQLSLETGSGPAFTPAIALYHTHGFVDCGPFADYRPDPFSRFMTLEL